MEYNTHPQFAGSQAIKDAQKRQLDLFEAWASENWWGNFHSSHYDWWMFPIDELSSYGYAWTVYEGDILELKKDGDYVRNYLRGAELLALSWGWDLLERKYVTDPAPDQKWQQWPIRLYKAAKSLKLFGFAEYFESFRMLATDLMQRGEKMSYNGRDLGNLFR